MRDSERRPETGTTRDQHCCCSSRSHEACLCLVYELRLFVLMNSLSHGDSYTDTNSCCPFAQTLSTSFADGRWSLSCIRASESVSEGSTHSSSIALTSTEAHSLTHSGMSHPLPVILSLPSFALSCDVRQAQECVLLHDCSTLGCLHQPLSLMPSRIFMSVLSCPLS